MAEDPRDRLFELARAQGFALCGVAPARPSRHTDAYDEWIDSGQHGEMHYLQNHRALRQDPAGLLPGAQAVICVADAYPTTATSAAGEPEDDTPRGRVARYAWGKDYHKTIKKRLHALADALREAHPEAAFRCAVDTAPLLERELAAAAGLGWIGKHTLLINAKLGSWLLLGAIVTTLPLQPTAPGEGVGPIVNDTDHCGTCTRCIDACPTDAITTDDVQRSLDATRCISYLTLEHRSPIDAALHAGIGDWVGGCDICQEVCPHNDHTPPIDFHPNYTPGRASQGFRLVDMLRWTEDDRREQLQGSALKRMKLPMLQRNAAIAARNALAKQDHPELRDALASYETSLQSAPPETAD